jgi:hypothetical protein
MNESFLSFIWQFRLFPGDALLKDSRSFKVESTGTLNRDSGPDFLGARIRIGEALWAGNVEIHMKSSDWNLHGHQHDMAYATVILHVVFEHDKEVLLPDQTPLPVFELKPFVDPLLYTRYLQFMASPQEIPCASLLKSDQIPLPGQWLISLGMQRMIRKGDELAYLLQRLGADWTEILYVAFCRGFGNKINDDLFEMLALKTPLKLIRKYADDTTMLEALLFGQAGLIPKEEDAIQDPYLTMIRDAYRQIRYQHQCEPMEAHLWRFLRTRPANFPTIRIAQMAALIKSYVALNPLNPEELHKWIDQATLTEVAGYWQQHYHFGKPGKKLPKAIGKESAERIVINGLMPPLLKYGEIYKQHHFISTMIDEISGMPPEANRIIRRWKQCGISPSSALESQGLTELFNEFCRSKRCLDCRFGHHLLSKSFIQA